MENSSQDFISKYSGRFDTPGVMHPFTVYQYKDHLLYAIHSYPQFHDGDYEEHTQSMESFKKNGPIIDLEDFDDRERENFQKWMSSIT